MLTGEILNEEAFDYTGPLDLCGGGPSIPSPPPPPEPLDIPPPKASDREVEEARARRRQHESRRKGSRRSLLTGGQGASGTPTTKQGGVTKLGS